MDFTFTKSLTPHVLQLLTGAFHLSYANKEATMKFLIVRLAGAVLITLLFAAIPAAAGCTEQCWDQHYSCIQPEESYCNAFCYDYYYLPCWNQVFPIYMLSCNVCMYYPDPTPCLADCWNYYYQMTDQQCYPVYVQCYDPCYSQRTQECDASYNQCLDSCG
jgi:hypothetical protein